MVVRIGVAYVALGALLGVGQFAHAAEKIGDEAEASRAGAKYGYDVDRIRADVEGRASRFVYSGSVPGRITAVPTPAQLKQMSEDKLFALCVIWNPGIRSAAAAELARRGNEVYPSIIARSKSPDAALRTASARVLIALIERARSDREQKKFLLARAEELLPTVARLFRDSDDGVRRQTQKAYEVVARISKDFEQVDATTLKAFIQSGFEQAAVETDPHICQGILIALSRGRGWVNLLDRGGRANLLAKALLQQPFPRGKGSIVRIIAQLNPEEIKTILPELLKDYLTPCLRDSMFFPGSRPMSFKLIMDHGKDSPDIQNKAIAGANAFNREPWVSFSGRHRGGMRTFWTALGNAGPRARQALPSLRELQADAEKRLAETDKNSSRYVQAKEIADYGRDVIAKIEK